MREFTQMVQLRIGQVAKLMTSKQTNKRTKVAFLIVESKWMAIFIWHFYKPNDKLGTNLSNYLLSISLPLSLSLSLSLSFSLSHSNLLMSYASFSTDEKWWFVAENIFKLWWVIAANMTTSASYSRIPQGQHAVLNIIVALKRT